MARPRMSALIAAGVTMSCLSTPSEAQSWQTRSATMALKSGESMEVGNLYYVVNCRSLLTAPPEATVLSGPAGVTVEVKEEMVTPRVQQCSRPVKGAKLILKAGDIADESETTMTVRVAYATKDGPRTVSYNIALSLFPAQ